MKRIISLYIILIISLVSPVAYAYWTSNILESNTVINPTITIGTWFNILDEGFNLNIWQDEGILNQVIPNNQIFSYNNLLYVVREGETYNPHYHGLPGSGSNQWAYVSLELEWKPNMNYRTNAIVVRDGRYFIANHVYNNDWFVNDPLSSTNQPWSEWREIQPVYEFNYLEGTNLPDYRKNPNEVTYL